MKLDDILGLLFLIFFVVIPAVQGLMKRGGTPPQDLDPDVFPQPTAQKPKTAQPSSRPPATTAPPAPSRPAPQAQVPKPKPAAPKPAAKPMVTAKVEAKKSKTLEDIERERLGRPSSRPAQNPARASQQNQAPTVSKSEPAQTWAYTADPHAILNGIVWQQVLSEPRSKYWRNRRKPKP